VKEALEAVWHSGRRLRRLENSIAQARAGQADLERRVELFEEIVAAAGVAQHESVAADPVPPSLLAAARNSRRKNVLVRLDVESRQVIAVIGEDGGDPHEWWPAIRHFTTRLRSASALHLERAMLPPGLSVVACRDSHGDLAVYVSQLLDTAQQKAAVMEAIRASRRAGWRAGLGPAGAGVALLIALRGLLPRAARALSARPVAWGAAATATVAAAAAAGVFLAAAPHQHSPAASARPPASVSILPDQPPGQQHAHPRSPGRLQPVTAAGSSPGTGRTHRAGSPRPGRRSPDPAPSASPAPGPSSPAPSASPAPSPSPSASSPPPGGKGICVTLLGQPVCLPPV
jgi:pyruvate/2-oxoglutarate dehydrogenase complex dihydrolipoamide acyltransferase (E2) component